MADVTTLAESAQAIFCAYADYVGESKAQQKLNIKTYPTFDSFAMGVVACKDEIYDAVMDASPMGSVELFHGYTYSGIPVAVAAGLAVQDIFEKEDIFNRAKNLAPYFQKGLFSLQDLESVENIRGYGMMGGIDMKMNTKPGKAGYECFKACYEAGVNFKATGDCLIIAPQFICEEKHIDEIIDKLRTGITNYQKNQKN